MLGEFGVLHAMLRRFVQRGALLVRMPDGSETLFGPGGEPAGGLHLKTSRAVRRMIANPSLALGELYMDGELEPIGSLHGMLNVLSLNQTLMGDPGFSWILDWGRKAIRRLKQINPAGLARRRISHHYDIDEAVYGLFLDADRQYSCAYFPTGRETLEEAQLAKKRHIAAKLQLDRPGLEVLDIGCGWGGMALTLAREYGAKVTGITLSREQLAIARARAQEAGLEKQVRFELVDYRAWTQPMDRIVSVGMVEHVGINHFQAYFGMISRSLRENGVALVHGIGRSDGPGATNPWINRYIFPGGYSPALSEVVPAVEKSGLWITDIEILRLHYARTLAEWSRRFAAHREEIRARHDERFCRMFEFYLAGSEAAFLHGLHMNWQVQLTRTVDALPLSRDYMLRETPPGFADLPPVASSAA
ncbi:class I SAM-dependent methyltransferase [Roseococcus sp. YIM B11640]|uniref:class I SAM-dependent methyltransferase n=1 Tax=Roseococcus sp. YIM B11640 TaxID=3133973 RepID=UPI003C7B18A0